MSDGDADLEVENLEMAWMEMVNVAMRYWKKASK